MLSTGSGPATRRADRRPDRRRQRRRPDPAHDRRSRCPQPACWSACSTRGPTQRKGARVLLVLDVSGSMAEPAERRRRHQARPGQARRDRRARPVQGRPTRSACGCSRPSSAATGPEPTSTWCPSAPIGANSERARRRIDELSPAQRHAAVRRRRQESYQTMLDGYDADEDQRRRAAHRRAQRGRRPRATTTSATDAHRGRCGRRRQGDSVEAGAHLHDRLRVRRRHRHAQGHLRGDQRGRLLRASDPATHQPGVHRGRQQLLTSSASLRSATASSPPRWRAIHHRRRRRSWPSGPATAIGDPDRPGARSARWSAARRSLAGRVGWAIALPRRARATRESTRSCWPSRGGEPCRATRSPSRNDQVADTVRRARCAGGSRGALVDRHSIEEQ